MKTIDSLDELKKIQFNILLTIHEFCVNNNIQYSLSCGTLLGAIRHKGFIPWDDDIDIMLTRDEYNKLLSIFPEKNKNVSLISLERDKNWNRSYARAYDTRTLQFEHVYGNVKGIGVGIDIFPIDNTPNDEREWKRYNDKRFFLQKLYMYKSAKWAKGRFLKNIVFYIIHIPLLPFSMRDLATKIDKMAQRFNDIDSQYVYDNCLGISKSRKRFKKEVFDSYIDVSFEGVKFKSIIGHDHYLAQTFGDYMELPPLEKRVSYHTFKAFWKD